MKIKIAKIETKKNQFAKNSYWTILYPVAGQKIMAMVDEIKSALPENDFIPNYLNVGSKGRDRFNGSFAILHNSKANQQAFLKIAQGK